MREPAQNVVALVVRTVAGRPFRRGGLLFSRVPLSVPLSSITPAQAAAILNEPALAVEEVVAEAPRALEVDVSDIPVITPSPEPSTPPAPEPIPSGEGALPVVVTVNVDAIPSPEQVAAAVVAALEAAPASTAASDPEPPPPSPPAPEPTRRRKKR